MIIDKHTEFGDSQDFAGVAAGTTNFADDINLVVGGNAMMQLYFAIHINETFLDLTSLQVELLTDDDVAFGSADTILTSPLFALADLNADMMALFTVRLPYALKQYLRARVITLGVTPTAGKISARLVQGLTLNDQFGYKG